REAAEPTTRTGRGCPRLGEPRAARTPVGEAQKERIEADARGQEYRVRRLEPAFHTLDIELARHTGRLRMTLHRRCKFPGRVLAFEGLQPETRQTGQQEEERDNIEKEREWPNHRTVATLVGRACELTRPGDEHAQRVPDTPGLPE